MWMILTGKGWEFLCYLLTATLSIHLLFYVYLRHRFPSLTAANPDLRRQDKNFLYVWLVLYLLRMWGSIRFLIFTIASDEAIQSGTTLFNVMNVLLYFQAVGDTGQAFANFLLFCVADEKVRTELMSRCCRCSCREDQEDDQQSVLGAGESVGDSEDYEAINTHSSQNSVSGNRSPLDNHIYDS